ncbi:MAG: sigma-54-dependent Fis family transcriptional regulator [Deltaproteobacteria bacterium]|nr:sigma-54-dependent Fis family transcriptional regulator [Deltaproteobacteria bacterium]
MSSILVISDERDVIRSIRSCFEMETGIESVSGRVAAMDTLRKRHYDAILIDLKILLESNRNMTYKEVLQPFWSLHPSIQIIIMTSKEMIREAIGILKAGAANYLTYPIDPEEVKCVMDTVRESQIVLGELNYLRDKSWVVDSSEFIYSNSSVMKLLYEKVKAVAPTKSTVLLIGETGTGKGVLSKLLHKYSNRKNNQFISVHCGAIPDTLLESELFGHEKGAFTGAVRRKLGKFEIAEGGTIFLDEIGTITPSAQIKLLQVLQDGTFQRVGGEGTLEVDVRVIAATNVDLKKMCEEGTFRKDLFYRLNVFPIEIPPLRERIEDIPGLIDGFLRKMNRFNTKNIFDIDSQVLEAFQEYAWPGNIRELENLIERAYILETSSVLTPESFPSELFEQASVLATLPVDTSLTLAEARKKGIENIERNYLKDVLNRNRGKIKDSAQDAAITTRQLHKLMTRYGLRKEEFKS